ncbi:MAG: CinA family protein, partial [Chloroflexi bacterium]|nr:CinA family protein [Chloroflexota bacterium]
MSAMEEVEAAAKRAATKLVKANLTIALAEATGCGLIGYLLTGIPGSSRYYLGGLSPYSRQGKVRGLGMSESLLDEKGSVSSETALEMAHMVRDLFDSDLGVAETGIAGPGGGT